MTRTNTDHMGTEMSPVSLIQAMDSAAFQQHGQKLDWLVEGVLVRGQAGVLGGPTKCLKTSIAVDLAISLASRIPFLNAFSIRRKRKVAFFAKEAGHSFLADVARRVSTAKGVDLAQCSIDWSHSQPVLDHPEHLRELTGFLRKNKTEVVIIDPLYLYLLSVGQSVSASNIYEIGPVYHRAAEACLSAGATPIFVHPTTKHANSRAGYSGTPIGLGDLAFVGIGESVLQWMLLTRRKYHQIGTGRHELLISFGGNLGQAGSKILVIDEGVVGKNFLGRGWAVEALDAKPKSERIPVRDEEAFEEFTSDVSAN
jgi:AAA domain